MLFPTGRARALLFALPGPDFHGARRQGAHNAPELVGLRQGRCKKLEETPLRPCRGGGICFRDPCSRMLFIAAFLLSDFLAIHDRAL